MSEETNEVPYEEYVILEGRAFGSHLLTNGAENCETDEDKFVMFDVTSQAAIHITATLYFNEVIAHMRKSGPVTEEEFFAKLKEKILKEVEEIKSNMSFAAGTSQLQ